MRDQFELGSKLIGLFFVASGLLGLASVVVLVLNGLVGWNGVENPSAVQIALQEQMNAILLRTLLSIIALMGASIGIGFWLMRSDNVFVRIAYGRRRSTPAAPPQAPAADQKPPPDDYQPPRM